MKTGRCSVARILGISPIEPVTSSAKTSPSELGWSAPSRLSRSLTPLGFNTLVIGCVDNGPARKDIAGRSRSVNKCISIISELQSCLDLKSGGEIAVSLNRLYDYMKTRIFTASAEQSSRPLEEIESLLQNLQSAWRTLADQAREGIETPRSMDIPDAAVLGAVAPAAALPAKSFNVSI